MGIGRIQTTREISQYDFSPLHEALYLISLATGNKIVAFTEVITPRQIAATLGKVLNIKVCIEETSLKQFDESKEANDGQLEELWYNMKFFYDKCVFKF